MNAFELFGDLKVGTSGFENSLQNAEARLNQTQRAIQDTEKSAESLGQTNARTARSFEKLNDTVNQNRDRMRQAVDAYEKGNISAGKLSTVLRQTDSRVTSLNSRLSDTKARMADVAKGTSYLGSIFKQALSASLLAGGIEGATRAIAGFGKESVQMFASLDKLVRFTATLDKNFQSPENLQKFRQDIQKLSTEIPQSAENIAKASFTLKSAFQKATAPELIVFLREFGNAATASNTDIATHTQNLAALAKSYKLTAAELPKFSALIASSFGQALAGDAEVARGFNIVLNAARSTKQPLEDMVAAMSTLQSVSNDAARNTTLLENVFAKITDPKYIEGFKQIGVSVFDTAGNFRPLNAIVNDLAVKLKGLNDQQITDKLAFAKDMQAREGLKALTREVQAYNKVLADGSDQDAFTAKNKLMFESAEAKIERLTNKWNSAKIEIGAALVDITEGYQKLFKEGPKLDTAGWTDGLISAVRIMASGAGAANVPIFTSEGKTLGQAYTQGVEKGIAQGQNPTAAVMNLAISTAVSQSLPHATKGGITLGQQLSFGIAQGIRSSQAFGSISGAVAGAIDWAFGAGQKAQESKSPSERAARELGLPFAQGIALGITQGEGLIGRSVTDMINKSMFSPAVKKAIATQIKELNKALAAVTTETGVLAAGGTTNLRNQIFEAERGKSVLEDLLRIRQEMGVNVDKPLILGPNALREIAELNNVKDAISTIVGDVKELTKEKDPLTNIFKTFADPRAADELKRQADALGLTVEKLKLLAQLGTVTPEWLESVRELGQGGPLLGTSETGTGSAPFGFDPEAIASGLEPPPRLKPMWEDFWTTLRTQAESFKNSLPSIKQSIGENLLGGLASIGDIVGSSIARADGTLRGFFTSIAQGFRQMAQSIIGDLVRILIYKSLLNLFASIGSSSLGVLGPGSGSDPTGGGLLNPFAEGGLVRGPGTSKSDSVFARLSNGEFVMSAKSVKKLGVGFLNSLNSLKMPALAGGGMASPSFVPNFSGSSSSVTTTNNTPIVVHNHFHNNNADATFAKRSAEQAAKSNVAFINRSVARG